MVDILDLSNGLEMPSAKQNKALSWLIESECIFRNEAEGREQALLVQDPSETKGNRRFQCPLAQFIW